MNTWMSMLTAAVLVVGCSAETVSPMATTQRNQPTHGASGATGSVLAGSPGTALGAAGSSALSPLGVAAPRAGTGAPAPAANGGNPALGTTTVTGSAAAGSGAPVGSTNTMPATGSSNSMPTTGMMPVATATGGTEPSIPEPKGDCPNIVSGPLVISGVTLQAQVGVKSATQKGPIMIYWHGTGGNALLALSEIAANATSEIMAAGGLIVSMESGGMGGAIDWGVYTQGDFDLVDQVVACAVKQMNIDTRRIYTGGSSAGGLAAGTLAFFRSMYIAAANPNSGGVAPWPGNNVLKDPTHVPAALTMHGAMGVDMVVIDFGQASMDMDNALVAAGGFAVDCDHGGGHVGAPPDLEAAGWVFMQAHPFGTKPSPYAGGLPATFPSYCKIVGK